MNAIVSPVVDPTSDVSTAGPAWSDAEYVAALAENASRDAARDVAWDAQDALDRMARNRASATRLGSLAQPAAMPPIPPRAFRMMQLTQAIKEARDELAIADCARRAARGRVAKEKLRSPVTRARSRLNAAEAALTAEKHGAEMADAVMRTNQVRSDVLVPVRTGEMRDGKHVVRMERQDVVLRQAQVVVSDAGRIEKVTALGRLVRDRCLTQQQGAALVRYREAHEASEAGLFGGGLNPDAVGGSGSSTGGNARIESAVADGILLGKMRAALFPRGLNLVEHVAVRGLTVASWAAQQEMNPARAMGLLEAVADILAGVE